MTRVVLALDLGTSSCKGALYTASGERIATASVSYPLLTPEPHFVEQDAADYVRAAREVTRQLASHPVAIEAAGFSTQTPTLVACDAHGDAIAPALVWQDSRASAQAQQLLDDADAATRHEWFGMDLPIAAATTPPKLLWWKQNRPEMWAATRLVMQPKDYAAGQLTGSFATDRWCAKGIAHLGTGRMHPGWMAYLGKTHDISPPVHPTRHVCGHARPNDWGLRKGTPVITGWSDAMAAILATGALQNERRGFVLTGTSEIIGMSRRESLPAPGLFLVPPDVLESDGLYLHYGPTQAGGSCLQWIARLLGKPAEDLLPAEARLTSIVCRPYWLGERAPYWDHTLTASFEGLRSEHAAADIVTAVLQGVALQERVVLERAARGSEVREIVLAGGAARNAAWNGIRAGIHQKPLLVMRDTEASLRGAAMLAWNLPAATDWFAADRIEPDVALAATAAELLVRFERRPL